MGIWSWLKTPSLNDTADPTVNLRENWAPSTVNNSIRAILARVAEFRDDLSGTIVTGGANSAYTVASFAVVVDGNTDYLDNVMVAFTPHATNAANPTLNVDSGGALPLRGFSGVALPAGVLAEGSPYLAVLGPNKDEWLLHGYRVEPTTIPIGGFIPYCGASAPNSQFVLPYGQALSRTTYATLFDLCGTTFGVGDGSTTFNIPDLRDRAIFGLGNMGGSAANRITSAGSGIDSTVRGANGGGQNVALTRANLPDETVSVNVVDPGHSHTVNDAASAFVAFAGGAITGARETGGVNTQNAVTGITANFALNGGVTQTNVNKMPPAIVLPFIMRVI